MLWALMLQIVISSLLWACTAAPAPAPAPDPAPAPPPVVALITIDTWRFDHFSAQDTPNLWALAQQGQRYDNAWTPIGLTSPAHATMLTGLMPWEHGMRANNHHGYRLRSDVPVIADTLGLVAGAFVSAYPAGPAGGLDRGFDIFDGPDSGERPGRIAVNHALAWLSKGEPAQHSAFLWVHLYEPHGPYKGKGATDSERYSEEVALADATLAPLLAELTRRGSRIVVAADHGEVLTEEPCGRQHERSIAPQVLHVPLFVWAPGMVPSVITARVGLSDVPALLQGLAPASHSVWLAESGMCEPSCAPGCAPTGLAGRDAVAMDDGGRWIHRPGLGTFSEGKPDPALRALAESLPPVPPPIGASAAETAALGYVGE
ncbi:MAG: sulfatase [Oligoflexia bacterium]|nr:sulfatase [Oligoflexia bacterium]